MREAVHRLDGMREEGNIEGTPLYFSGFIAAIAFHERAVLEGDDYAPLIFNEAWEFADGLGRVQRLLDED